MSKTGVCAGAREGELAFTAPGLYKGYEGDADDEIFESDGEGRGVVVKEGEDEFSAIVDGVG